MSKHPPSKVFSPSHHAVSGGVWLRHLSKLTCALTLFLIFAGAMVKSTDSGLAVPDWPLSYGMLFPPMVGGVFYEHGHRMVAATVGFLTLCLALWLWIKERRRWVRMLGACALGAVLLQGFLGGITVLFFLPTPVSVFHGILAQIFLILTILISYSQSKERFTRDNSNIRVQAGFLRLILLWIAVVFVQLILGALMRHTGSGLAVFDFPRMGGYWIPPVNAEMLRRINDWRFENNMDFVTRAQVLYHLLHRLGAFIIVAMLAILNGAGFKPYAKNKSIGQVLIWINIFVAIQVLLGVLTVLTRKEPLLTSFHVVTGAVILGASVLLLLRAAPTSFDRFMRQLCE